MEKVKVTLDNYDKNKPYQLFLRVNDENGITTGYTCTSYDEYTYDRKSPGPRPVKKIKIKYADGETFKNYIDKGILSYDDFPEIDPYANISDFMWIAECGMVVIHIKNTEKDFIIYDLLHVSNRTFDSIEQPSEQKEYDEIDASFRHYVIDVVNGKPQPLMISDTMFYLNADKVDVEGETKQLTRPSNEDLIKDLNKDKTEDLPDNKVQIPDGYNEAVFTSTKQNPVISAIYLYGGNNVTHSKTIDGDVTVTENYPVKETKTVEGIETETGYMKYTFSGTGAISLW